MPGVEPWPGRDGGEDEPFGCEAVLDERGEEPAVVLDVFEHVEEEDRVEPPRRPLGGEGHPAIRADGQPLEDLRGVADVPARHRRRGREPREQLPREPAVAGADVEDGPGAAWSEPADEQVHEERPAGALPRMAHERPGGHLVQVHGTYSPP